MSALTDLFSSIASAIRTKSGSSATITASNFPTAIANIPTGAVTGTWSNANESRAMNITCTNAVGKKHCVIVFNGVFAPLLACLYTSNIDNDVYYSDRNGGHKVGAAPTWNPNTGVMSLPNSQYPFMGREYRWYAW